MQIIIGLGMMFGAGASSYISRLLGKGDNEQADRTASTALFSGLLVSSVIIMSILVFLDPVLTALGSTETILPYTASKPYGDYAVAAMGAVTRVMTVVTYIVFGFLKGFQPFAGYNYGSGKFDRLKKSIKLCMTWSTAFCVVAGIILIVFADPIVSLFGTDTLPISLTNH